MTQFDLAIIGAGPAGLAAAEQAAGLGLSVALLDEQQRPGGQIYRDVDRASAERGEILGPDYLRGRALTGATKASGVTYLPGATVWDMTPEGEVSYTHGGMAHELTAARVLLATGAQERPMPLPGWTLPGVMTAGAAQIMLKQSGLVAPRAVLVGSGPLLFLVAAQMVRAGTPPLALIETPAGISQALPHLPAALRGWRLLTKGLGLLSELRRAGILRHRNARNIRIEGDGSRATGISFDAKGKQHIACDCVLLHHGVVPNVQISRALRLEHVWDNAQACFSPVTDAWGRSSAEAIYVAGDGAGIGGAITAEQAGRLCALAIACDMGRIDTARRDTLAAPVRVKLSVQKAVRPFLDAAYPPAAEALSPADDTIICRCEETTAGDIRRCATLGCTGPNQTKAFTRAGMGPCQGRFCGLTVTQILAQELKCFPSEVGSYHQRSPFKPVTLGELSSLSDTVDNEKQA